MLRYHATIDTTEGSYPNTVSGYVGQVAATTATKTVVVRHMVDLSVAKSGTPSDSALVGDTLRFVITTRNAGPSKADHVVVTDTLPAGMTFLSATRSRKAHCRVHVSSPLFNRWKEKARKRARPNRSVSSSANRRLPAPT